MLAVLHYVLCKVWAAACWADFGEGKRQASCIGLASAGQGDGLEPQA